MGRDRTVPDVINAPVHGGTVKPCLSMNETAFHTVGLTEGHFAALVLSRNGDDAACIAILDRDDVEAHVTLLRNAMEDAERLDKGLPAIHAPQGGIN